MYIMMCVTMKNNDPFYAKCPSCKDYYEAAESLEDARNKLEKHEKEKHKGKPIGTFGKVMNP